VAAVLSADAEACLAAAVAVAVAVAAPRVARVAPPRAVVHHAAAVV